MKEIDEVKEPPKFAVKFANTVFILGILISVLIAIYAVHKIYNHPIRTTSIFYYICFLLSVIFAILLFLGFKLNSNLKINLSLVLFVFSISVYAFEIYLEFLKTSSVFIDNNKKTITNKLDVSYDTRSTLEVLNDLIDSGEDAYPDVSPYEFLLSENKTLLSEYIKSNNETFFPLSGISNITTFFTNESGYYPIIITDEHGFNNPKGLYKINEVDIVLTGDSFTEGYSVNSDETISSYLREAGFKTINSGQGGNGPLIELATLKEYAEPLQPKVVLWLFYENDFYDLKAEMHSSLLRKYLNEDDFSQNLISRQSEVDIFWKDYIQRNMEVLKERKRITEKLERTGISSLIRIVKISNIRSRFDIQDIHRNRKSHSNFTKILEKSVILVSKWGGKLYFVYLPSYSIFLDGKNYSFSNKIRNDVLGIINKLNIPIIDIKEEAFGLHPDPLSLFPQRKYHHYNAEGYHLVAKTISKRLKDDGIIPLESNN